jgi:hypothetical protein
MRIELFVLLVFLFTSCGYAPKYDRHITTITEQSDKAEDECNPSKTNPEITECEEQVPVDPSVLTVKPRPKPKPPVKPTVPTEPDYEKEEPSDPTQQQPDYPTQYPPVPSCVRNC